ncbi:hypothetical protein HK099_007245 [Clydaea vesicula]|uniref:Uncharacterized protein n=1 Tax=Clydaea vesicula TaxID=447962 RepID=A0AAD5U5K4_9FUNG|nr:hypothetical protein HK099_007245 [Clydaea vesicula]
MNQPDSIFHSNFEELKLDLKNLRKIETYCLLGETLQTKAFFSLVNLCENLVDLTIPFPNWESIQILKKNLMKLENLNIVNGEENFAEEEEIHLHEQDENKNFEICLNLILKNSLNLKSFTLNSSKYLTEKNLKLFSEVNFKNLISLELLISNFGLEFKSFKTYLLKFVGGGLVRILLDLRNFLMNDEMLIDFSFYLPKIVHFEIWTSDASSVTLKGAKSLIEKCANLRRIHDCGFSEEVKSYFMKNRVDCRSFMMEVR